MKKEPVILVVDDEEKDRDWIREAVGGKYQLVEVSNGRDALSELSMRPDIDAIVLDLVMPVMDGFDLLSELMKSPELAVLPVFVLTAQKEEVFEANALKLGAMDYATKGVRKDVFRLRLQNLLERSVPKSGPVSEAYDDLTGFFKRTPFYERVSERLDVADKGYDLMAMDICRFSLINTNFGEKEGNRLLSWLADLVRKEFDGALLLGCRLYADRFIFLMERKIYEEKLPHFSERLLSNYPLDVDIRVKFGIYEIGNRQIDIGKMCEGAFSAVNLTKDHFDMEFAHYSEETHAQVLGEKHLTDEMRRALVEEQFQVYMQPKFDIDKDKIIGAESLVRWVHPERGMIPPNEFIPLFERNGFVGELDSYVWNKTAETIARWKKEGKPVVPVSVNVSRNDIYAMDILKVIPDIVDRNGISPELLHLEITE
ncbi:MAG: EAL domain-containing protein, partial [Lachnospiraceae bacterium]|nr:EAL domain-containing protein [Lachnospiraceae bacterium]